MDAAEATGQGASTSEQWPRGSTTRRIPLALATWVLIGLVLLIVVVLLVVKLTRGSTTVATPPVVPAPAAVVQAASTVPTSVFDKVGTPQPPLLTPPAVLTGQPSLTVDGRTGVVYLGGEFCPYCAAERWALLVALSRFGTFGALGATSSSTAQVFPGLKTFSFDGATYRSTLVGLSAVEAFGPDPSVTAPAGYPQLHRIPALQQELARRFAHGSSTTTLPFVDVANRVLISGSGIGFSPEVLQGLSMSQIANALHQPGSTVARAVDGAANDIAAAICSATGGRPRSVCSTNAVQASQRMLGLVP